MRLSRLCAAAAGLALFPGVAVAADEDFNTSFQAKNANETITMDLGFGYMNAKAHELVYDPADGGRKISELIWEMDAAAVMQVGLGFQLTDTMKLKLRGTFGIDGNAYMEDYDWLDATTPDTWTHLSTHDDTGLDRYTKLDAAFQWDFARLEGVTIGALLGVRGTDIQWSAHGGNYTYSTNGFRDDIGSFDAGAKVITYEQFYGSPYLGLAAGLDTGQFAFNGSVIASIVADGGSEDHHWLRGLVFEDSFDMNTMFALQAEALYRYNSAYQFFANVEYEHYADTFASTDVFDMAGSLVGVFDGDSAGADHTSLTAVAGLRVAY
jgi:outer membrane protease